MHIMNSKNKSWIPTVGRNNKSVENTVTTINSKIISSKQKGNIGNCK